MIAGITADYFFIHFCYFIFLFCIFIILEYDMAGDFVNKGALMIISANF